MKGILKKFFGAYVFLNFAGSIVENNKEKKIILVLDNSKSHHADKTVRKARELEITLVFLPPYSPDLNPVELCGKR